MGQQGPQAQDIKALAEALVACADQQFARFAGADASEKADGSVVTALDHALQHALQQRLQELQPDYGFLGEEMSADEHRRLLQSESGPLWILDPLDGTTNFAAGLPFYSVSLALVENGTPLAGVIYDPARRECFTASRGRGVWCNGEPLRPHSRASDLRSALACVDFKRLRGPLPARIAQQPPYRSQRNLGSCALEWCWLAAGRFHLYLHGGMKLWDHAAGYLLLNEAGGRATTLAGEPLRSDTTVAQSVVAARDPDLQRQWYDWITEASKE